MEEKRLALRDGTELCLRVVNKGHPVWLIATHGIGEHLWRNKFIEELFEGHFNIVQYDLRGHGKSSGKRGYVDDFYDYVEDLKEIVQHLSSQWGMKRHMLFGHSMGALITAAYLQKLDDKFFTPEKVFLSAPPVSIPGALGKLVQLIPDGVIKFLASGPVGLRLSKIVDTNYISHEPKVIQAYLNDDLVIGNPHSRLLFNLIRTAMDVFKKPLNSKCKIYCAVGSGDRIVDPQAIEHYVKEIDNSIDLKVIDDAFHEMHNEIEIYRTRYFSYLVDSLSK